jgi:hypothetical protein
MSADAKSFFLGLLWLDLSVQIFNCEHVHALKLREIVAAISEKYRKS